MIPEITIPFFHSLVHSFSKREEKKKNSRFFNPGKKWPCIELKKERKNLEKELKIKKKKKKSMQISVPR